MPQLDKLTFLSQFFWFCFFYLSFYFIVLKYFLPKLNRILKVRKKKMGSSSDVTMKQGLHDVLWRYIKPCETHHALRCRSLHEALRRFRSDLKCAYKNTSSWQEKVVEIKNKQELRATHDIYFNRVSNSCILENFIINRLESIFPLGLQNMLCLRAKSNEEKLFVLTLLLSFKHKKRPTL